jgi:hypothetical protein
MALGAISQCEFTGYARTEEGRRKQEEGSRKKEESKRASRAILEKMAGETP